MFWMVVLGLLLFFLCAVLFVLEVFIPSFGIISVCATGALAAGVIVFFHISPQAGWLGVAIALIEIPIVFVIAYKIFPNTSLGKSILLAKPNISPGQAVPDTPVLQNMLGQSGIAVTDLRPIGIADFAGHRLESLAESGYIDKDTKIEIIKVEGSQLTVRPIE